MVLRGECRDWKILRGTLCTSILVSLSPVSPISGGEVSCLKIKHFHIFNILFNLFIVTHCVYDFVSTWHKILRMVYLNFLIITIQAHREKADAGL